MWSPLKKKPEKVNAAHRDVEAEKAEALYFWQAYNKVTK